jgi:hypothetical protein
MFSLRLAAGVCMGYDIAVARGATARQLIDCAAEFAPGQCGVVASGWFERDGRYVAEIYDWCDSWFSGPLPVLGEVIAPPGFRPPDKRQT